MRFLVLLLFIAVPLAEIAVFIRVGEAIGIAATIALVVLTAVIGVALLRRQGMAALAKAQAALDAGELPLDPVIDGVCLLVAGAFLLTPGLITDAVGFLLMAPALRRRLARGLLERMMRSGRVTVRGAGPRRPSGSEGPGPVIEGEFKEIDEEESGERPGAARQDREKDAASPWRR